MMGSQAGDGIDPPPIEDLEPSALRDRATALLAAYHGIDLAEAGTLLVVLAEYRDCSVDALATEIVRKAVAYPSGIDEPFRPAPSCPNEGNPPRQAGPDGLGGSAAG